ncbi:hypothetical protein ACVII0_006093 [Sinorhizobium meliloti]
MFRHRTGREHATDFRRLPWSARVRTVRTGMQLYAGQEAGKSEMQAVKVNTRGTGFRYASLGSCAHSPSPPSAVPSASNLESICVLDGSGSACAETARSGRIESAIRFIFCLGCLRVSARDRIIRLLKRVLPRQLSRGSKQLYFEPVHTTATRSLVLGVGAEDLPGAYALDWQIFTSMPADTRFIPFSYFWICWKLTPTFFAKIF